MPTQKEIAKRWGVSCVRVHQLVKKGCPTSSFKAADKWRAANPPKRAPTNGKGVAPEAKPVTKTAKAVNQSPRINPKAAEKMRKAAKKPVGRSKGPPESEKKPALPFPPKSGDSLLDALNGIIVVSDYAFTKFIDASENNPYEAGARLSEYVRALTARTNMEEAYRKELQVRGVLVDKGIVFQTARQAIEAVLKRLRRMPIEIGPQCNPQEPLRATKILQREVDGVISAGSKEILAIRAARNQLRGTRLDQKAVRSTNSDISVNAM